MVEVDHAFSNCKCSKNAPSETGEPLEDPERLRIGREELFRLRDGQRLGDLF
jgi:hypothetical protein